MGVYDVVGAFQAIEEDLIQSMARNMRRHIGEENDEGINWTQWQAEMLNGLAQYKAENIDKLKGYYSTINDSINDLIKQAYKTGESDQEIDILKAIQEGYKADRTGKGTNAMQGAFFKINEGKLNALIKATSDDFNKAESSILRRTNDIYRQTIFNTQMYYNAGAGGLYKAVDMATKDFLAAGINNIEYKNGARVNIASYAEMALRTSNKRANLLGAGNKRQEYGIDTVKVTAHASACPKCIQWQGRVYYDDVYGGYAGKGGEYPLLSEAVAGGMFHPNCRNGISTYYEGISAPPKEPTDKQIEEMQNRYYLTQRQRACERNIRKYKRLSIGSMDATNKAKYRALERTWLEEYRKLINSHSYLLREERERLRLYGIVDIPKGKIKSRINIPKIEPNKNTIKQALDKIKSEVKFVAAKNIKEANDFILNNFGIKAEYKGVNIDVANEWNKALTKAFNKFPALVDNFGFVGDSHQRNKLIKEFVYQDKYKFAYDYYTNLKYKDAAELAEKYAKSEATKFLKRYTKVSACEMASSWAPSGKYADFRGVCINGKNANFKTLKSAIDSLKWQVEIKFHPQGGEKVASILDHEIGHQLDDMLGIGKMPEVQKLYDSRTIRDITNDLSRYAWDNDNSDKYSEFIAEAWSEYCNADKPREIAKTIGEIIEKAYKDKFGG